MANIDGSLWKGEEPNFQYAVRSPYKDLAVFKNLYLAPDQNGILISADGFLAQYKEIQNELDRNLIPSAPKFAGISLGKVNPAKAEMWIVNCYRPGSTSFTIDNLEVLDPATSKIFPLKINIEYRVNVSNSRDFINHYIGFGGGNKSNISARDLHKDIFAQQDTLLREEIRKFIERAGVRQKNNPKFLLALTAALENWLYERLLHKGLQLNFINVTEVEVDLDKVSPLKRHFLMSVFETEIPTPPSYPATTQAYRSLPPGTQPHNSESPQIIYCAQCSKKHLSTEKFCPYCGNEYRPCPSCGSDTLKAAKRCVNCGVQLKQTPAPSTCEKCGSTVIAGSSFCPNCGCPQQIVNPDSRFCPRCKTQVPLTSKFCTKCGFKI